MAEIIQQWQFPGPVHPELLKDSVFASCRKLGITSLQSYFTWAGIEKEKDRFDFSDYDLLVFQLKKYNLKWVPFLILGPEYATPGWFKKSTESVFAKCLEHGQEGAIQSIWNPYLKKYIERFLKAFACHYKDHKIFESITLGISGNWGEAVYPAEGGFNKGFHTHLGFWAGDKYAKESFAKFALSKYGKIDSLNSNWNKNYKDSKEIDFPTIKKERVRVLFNTLTGILQKTPSFLKIPLRFFKNLFLSLTGKKFSLVSEPDFTAYGLEEAERKNHWQDFIEWYLNSMINFAEFWLKATRKHFPQTKIYLVTGGIGEPASGADFSQQVKIAKKYQAGIRITNQTNDYQQSFILTRLVSSAARFYGTYFTTEEEAILQTGQGAVMRIFDVISSGAAGLYCKNFISTGNDDPCVKKDLPAGKITIAGRALEKNLDFLSFNENSIRKPLIKTAVFFPLISIIFDSSLIKNLYNHCVQLRDILDFDLIDEKMISDGALKKYKFLLVLAGDLPAGEIRDKIKKWENQGGKIIVNPEKEDLEKLSRKVNEIDSEPDGVFATRFEKGIIYYNANNKKIKKEIKLLNKTVEIEPNSILAIKT